MSLIVHKYGGTSMGSTERIRNVAKRVAKWARAGHQMIVVPSAMSGETNRLLGLAKELQPQQLTPSVMREMDAIAATGEQVSVGLLSIALQAEGLQAVSYAGWQLPIDTDSSYTKARIQRIDDVRVRADGLVARMDQYRAGDKIRLLVARRDRLVTLDVTLGAEPGRPWRLQPKPDATADQLRNLSAWLGQ